MNIIWIIALGFTTSVMILCTIVQAVDSAKNLISTINSHGTKKPNRPLLVRTVVMVAVSIVLGFLTVFANINISTASQLSRGITTTATTVPGRSTFTPTSVLTPSPSINDTTPTSTSTQTTGGVITTKQWLACTRCNTPIRIRIDTITIDTLNANTAWAITLVNNSGAAQSGDLRFFNLQDTSNNMQTGTGDLISNGFNLDVGKAEASQIIIPFLPYPGQHYMLKVELYVGSYSSLIDYDDFSLSF